MKPTQMDENEGVLVEDTEQDAALRSGDVNVTRLDRSMLRAMEEECERFRAGQLQDWEDKVLREAMGH